VEVPPTAAAETSEVRVEEGTTSQVVGECRVGLVFFFFCLLLSVSGF
jgi:hypothetical protein